MRKFIEVGTNYINLRNVVSIKFEMNRVIFNYNSAISIVDGMVSPDYTYVEIDALERKELKETLENEGFITFELSDNSNIYVNLDNVTFIKEYIRLGHNPKFRLIFNMNVGATLKDSYKITSSAVYYDFSTEEDLIKSSDELSRLIKNKGE